MYLFGGRDLPPDDSAWREGGSSKAQREGARVVLVMVLHAASLTLFWVAQTQIWKRITFGSEITWTSRSATGKCRSRGLQSVDALGVVVRVLPMLRFWRWQAARSSEPDDVRKTRYRAAYFQRRDRMVSRRPVGLPTRRPSAVGMALVYHFLSRLVIFISRRSRSRCSRGRQPRRSMLCDRHLLSVDLAGSTISGRLGGLYERSPPPSSGSSMRRSSRRADS